MTVGRRAFMAHSSMTFFEKMAQNFSFSAPKKFCTDAYRHSSAMVPDIEFPCSVPS